MYLFCALIHYTRAFSVVGVQNRCVHFSNLFAKHQYEIHQAFQLSRSCFFFSQTHILTFSWHNNYTNNLKYLWIQRYNSYFPTNRTVGWKSAKLLLYRRHYPNGTFARIKYICDMYAKIEYKMKMLPKNCLRQQRLM